MPEARSKAHYRMVWKEEVDTLTRLKYSIPQEDFKKVDEFQAELMKLVEKGAENLKKPDVCPDCATRYCGYRKHCAENQ